MEQPSTSTSRQSLLGVVSITTAISGYASILFFQIKSWGTVGTVFFYYLLGIEVIAMVLGFIAYKKSRQNNLLAGLSIAGATIGILYLGSVLMLILTYLLAY